MAILDLTADAHLLKRPTSKGLRTFKDRFSARLDYNYQGLAVMCRETSTDVWEISTFPGVSVVTVDSNLEFSSDYIFYGGNTYTVTGSLATALSTAGYDVS
jgi:hypothetical protein